MPLAVAGTSFLTNATTGNQVVAHGCAQTPKVIFFISGDAIADVNTVSKQVLGFGVGSGNQCCIANAASQGAGSAAAKSAISDVACFWMINSALVTQTKASMVSIDATNFTINIDVTDTVQRVIHFVALGGTELEADCISAVLTAGTGNQAIATTVADPAAVWLLSIGAQSSADTTSNNWKFDVGVAASPNKRAAIAGFSDDAELDTQTSRWQRIDRCNISVTAAEVTQAEYDLDSFSPSTVTIEKIVNAADRRVVGLVLGGIRCDVHSFNQSLSTGNQSITGVGFRPVLNFFFSQGAVATTAALATNLASVGYAIASNARKAFAWREQDAVALSAGLHGYSDQRCIRHISGTTTIVVDADANFVSNDVNGYTINNVIVDSTSRQVFALSIGNAQPGAGHSEAHSASPATSTNTQIGAGHADSHSTGFPDADTTISGAGHSEAHSAGQQTTTVTRTGSSHSESHSAGLPLTGNATDDTIVDPVTLPGDVFRTFQDGQARHWSAAVASYVETLSPGNNVLRPVQDQFPMPVQRRTGAGDEVPSTAVLDGTDFAASQPGVPILAIESDVAPEPINDGELGAPRMTNRDLNIVLRDPSGVNLGTSGNPLRVDPSGATVQPIGDASSSLTIDTSLGPITINGSVTISSGTLTANGGTGPFPAAGMAPHGSAVVGNPVLLGREARTTDPTAVANGQAVRTYADSLGKAVALIGAPHGLYGSGTVALTTATAADVLTAPGVGFRWAVTSVLVTNAHATVGTKVEIRDGTTVKDRGNAGPIDGGWSDDGTPMFVGSVNTAITARCVTSGADVDVSISGYRIAN